MYESWIRVDGTVVGTVQPCSLKVIGLWPTRYLEHDGRHHYGDNVCVLVDDPAKAGARARLAAAIRREEVGA